MYFRTQNFFIQLKIIKYLKQIGVVIKKQFLSSFSIYIYIRVLNSNQYYFEKQDKEKQVHIQANFDTLTNYDKKLPELIIFFSSYIFLAFVCFS